MPNNTKHLNLNFTRALLKEVGRPRISSELDVTKCTMNQWANVRGMPFIYARYLYLRYPHLLSWADFKISEEADLKNYIKENE